MTGSGNPNKNIPIFLPAQSHDIIHRAEAMDLVCSGLGWTATMLFDPDQARDWLRHDPAPRVFMTFRLAGREDTDRAAGIVQEAQELTIPVAVISDIDGPFDEFTLAAADLLIRSQGEDLTLRASAPERIAHWLGHYAPKPEHFTVC